MLARIFIVPFWLCNFWLSTKVIHSSWNNLGIYNKFIIWGLKAPVNDHLLKFYRKGLNLLEGHSNPTLPVCFKLLRTICRRLDYQYGISFSFFSHFHDNFSLPVTLLFIIIIVMSENLKKLIVNVNKQKDALKRMESQWMECNMLWNLKVSKIISHNN